MNKSFLFKVALGAAVLNFPAYFGTPKPFAFVFFLLYFLAVVTFGMWIGATLAEQANKEMQ